MTCLRQPDERLGRIQSTESRTHIAVVSALVPLKQMLGYADHLRFLSKGQAQFSLIYDSYKEVTLRNPPDDTPPAAIVLRP